LVWSLTHCSSSSHTATDDQSASSSWCRAPIWSLWPDFCFQSNDCGFLDVDLPVWREDGSVIYLFSSFWVLAEQSLLGRNSAEHTTTFYCLIWDSRNLEARSPYLNPLGTGWPSYNTEHWVLFSTPLTNRRATVMLKLKLKIIYGWQSVGQSVLVSGAHLGPVTNFSFSLKFSSDSCVFEKTCL
jgi:hypothetical protein